MTFRLTSCGFPDQEKALLVGLAGIFRRCILQTLLCLLPIKLGSDSHALFLSHRKKDASYTAACALQSDSATLRPGTGQARHFTHTPGFHPGTGADYYIALPKQAPDGCLLTFMCPTLSHALTQAPSLLPIPGTNLKHTPQIFLCMLSAAPGHIQILPSMDRTTAPYGLH